jgi:hypothetical protein
MHAITRTIVLLFALAVLVLAAGCGNLAEKAAETAVEGATGVDIEDDGDSVTIETDEGTVEIGSGEGELPEDFPDDVPVYDAEITSQGKVSTSDGTMWTVVLSTGDSYADVVSWYKDELAGTDWQQDALLESATPNNSASFILSKGEDANAAIAISEPEGGGDIDITLTVTE